MLCLIYVIAVGAVLGALAALVERILPPTTPRRWIWCTVLLMSVSLPGYQRMHHTTTLHAGHSALAFAGMDKLLLHVEAFSGPVAVVWVVASALIILSVLINVGRVEYLLRCARLARDARHRHVDGVRVVITEALGPATVGLWRTRVLLPSWVLALPPAHRRFVVEHEEQHRRSRDGALLYMAAACIVFMPWNVALWWQLRRLRLAVELDCDHRVVQVLGEPLRYASVLLSVAQASRRPRLQPAFLGSGTLERRLQSLLAPRRLSLAERLLLSVFVAVLFTLAVGVPHPLFVVPGSQIQRLRHP